MKRWREAAAGYAYRALVARFAGETSEAEGWNLTSDQVAALDKASEVPLIYPYWHQRGFADRNPPPV
jgi:hypothetical protein